MKTPEHLWFSGAFSGHKIGTLARHEVTILVENLNRVSSKVTSERKNSSCSLTKNYKQGLTKCNFKPSSPVHFRKQC